MPERGDGARAARVPAHVLPRMHPQRRLQQLLLPPLPPRAVAFRNHPQSTRKQLSLAVARSCPCPSRYYRMPKLTPLQALCGVRLRAPRMHPCSSPIPGDAPSHTHDGRMVSSLSMLSSGHVRCREHVLASSVSYSSDCRCLCLALICVSVGQLREHCASCDFRLVQCRFCPQMLVSNQVCLVCRVPPKTPSLTCVRCVPQAAQHEA